MTQAFRKVANVGEVPQDVMAALPGYAGLLPLNIDRAFPRAQAWLETKFPPWAFSVLEDWAQGAFNHLDAVVFSRCDDSAHRLYYYICELRRRGIVAGPEPLIFDVARIGRPTSEAHCIASVRQLAAQLTLTEADLQTGVQRTNARRAAVMHTTPRGRVCLLSGSLPVDRRLHNAMERVGWTTIGETLGESWTRLGAPVEAASGDAAAAIGAQVYAEQTGPRAFFGRSDALVRDAAQANAKAVVLWYIEEDEAQIWHLPAQRKALETAGIPTLVLTRCDMRAADAAPDRITTFLKDLMS